MSQTIDAVFDGEVLRPAGDLALPPNTHVRLTVEVLADDPPPAAPASFLRTAAALKLDGPRDWATRVKQYAL